MLFCFTSEDGHTIERSFPVGKAPKAVAVDGVSYARDFSAERKERTPEFRPYVTRALDRWTPGFKHAPNGRCVVESRAQENAYAKAKGLEWD